MIVVRVITGSVAVPDPADRGFVDVGLPVGFRRVFSGAVKPGDRFLNLLELREGLVRWDAADPMESGYDTADWYACLIRPDQHAVEEPCERCKGQARFQRNRFCEECCNIVVKAKGRTL